MKQHNKIKKKIVKKSDLSEFIENSNLDRKIVTLAIKVELKAKHNKIVKLQAFDSSHFEDDGTQNYLVFQPVFRYFKDTGNTNNISVWVSKGLSEEYIKPLLYLITVLFHH